MFHESSNQYHFRKVKSDEKGGNRLTLAYIGIMNRMFANGPGDLGSIPDRVIPKTQKW